MKNSKNPEVFKIQVPLHSSEENTPLLIYNRSRSIFFQMNITEGLQELIGDDSKIYVLGYIDGNNVFQIIRKVESQRW